MREGNAVTLCCSQHTICGFHHARPNDVRGGCPHPDAYNDNDLCTLCMTQIVRERDSTEATEGDVRVSGHVFKEIDRPQPVTTVLGMLAGLLDYGYNADSGCYRNWYAMQRARNLRDGLSGAGFAIERKSK